MDTKDAEFLKKLLAMFKVEAREHLHVISSGLTEMEKSDSKKQAEIVETVYREAHSLKGAARSVNLVDIVSLCQTMENVFSALKRGQIALSVRITDLLYQAVDFCSRLVDGEEFPATERAVLRKLIRRLDSSILGEVTFETENWRIGDPEPILPVADSPIPSLAAETVRISTAKLDSLLLQAEEMLAVKLATGQRAAELRDLKKAFDAWKKKRQGGNIIGILQNRSTVGPVSADPFVLSFETRLSAMAKAAEYDHRVSGALIDVLLEDMKKTLMLPLSSMLEMFPRFVRDLARAAGKKVELSMEGDEIEIDRRVLEEMKDPLLHLIRNCIDHGIETPDARERKKKSACGNLKIDISSGDGKIEIAVSDDGAGVDVSKIKSSAVKHAIISQEAADKLGEQEALLLAFSSGVTTSPMITDISGRGLGLAIVREKALKLNGTVTVNSRMDAGTTFRLVVPLTLTTFRGTLVRAFEQLFILPSSNVERVARIKKQEIQTVENRETLVFDGQPVSLVRLGDVLEMKAAGGRQQTDHSYVHVVLVGLAEKHLAFMVDEVLHEQEVLVKPLGGQLSRVRNIAGATVLGSGKVVPILNVPDLLKSAVKKTPSSAAVHVEEPEKSSSVLVVEDSITARTLLKNILEAAGYDVRTAVDGVDAITTLKSREFDIVVSDVEMPRMDGFDLTARIRADKKFAELPVVLVTALESREDRERGIDVGANAYIVKSSFDQSNLLEVIGRLT